MIVCDYLDENVKDYLNKETGNTVLTFFKETQLEYNKNKILFIDAILEEGDYKQIDEYTARLADIIKNVFADHVDFNGYRLSLYEKIYLERNTGIFKFKYAIDKLKKNENNKKIVFFDPGNHYTRLLSWLEKEYHIVLIRNPLPKSKNSIQSKIIKGLEKSHIVSIILDCLFKDRREKTCSVLWLGTRSLKSKLPKELEPDFKFQLLENDILRKLAFIRFGSLKYEVLKLKNHKKFNEKWACLEKRYDDALERIFSLTWIEIDLVPVITGSDKARLKRLLRASCILEDNKNNLDILFVEQSIVEEQVAAVDFFNRNGLPSIEVPHGVITVAPAHLAEVGATTKIAVYGERDKKIKEFIDDKKIIATGCPYYDRLFDIKDNEKTYEFLLLTLQWTMFFPSSDSHRSIFDQVSSLLKLLQFFENERLVIKLHPGQSERDEGYIWKLINSSDVSNRVEVKRNEDMVELLKRAKIVYNFGSSVGIEALLMKKPLVVLDFSTNRYIEFEEYEGCVVVKDYQELVQATQYILSDVERYLKVNNDKIEKTRRFLSADLKGESYKNVAAVCRELCQCSKKSKANN